MTLPSLATVDEFAAWMGVTIDNEERAEAILTAASTLVRSTSGRAWVDADGEPEDGLTETQSDAAHTVVLSVAERVWRNPQGLTSETSGPFSKSVAAWAAFGLELTETEKQMISLGSTTGIPGLTSVRVVAPALARGSAMHENWFWEDWDPDAVPT
jgi:hypothetical protein